MPLVEPAPPDPGFPRHTAAPFPRYRYVPGLSPHPRRDPGGHAFGQPEPRVQAIDPAAWEACALYLRGVDLFNFAYWWESHEAFEAIWRGVRSGTPTAELLQALVQIAASELKRFAGSPRPAEALAGRALGRLAAVPSPWLGLDVRALAGDVEARVAGRRALPPLLPRPRVAAGPLAAPRSGSTAPPLRHCRPAAARHRTVAARRRSLRASVHPSSTPIFHPSLQQRADLRQPRGAVRQLRRHGIPLALVLLRSPVQVARQP